MVAEWIKNVIQKITKLLKIGKRIITADTVVSLTCMKDKKGK